jgi:KTSC domain
LNVTGVESTTLKSIGYDESVGVLRLEFRSGAVYDFFGVPEEVHGALLQAPSIGACFNEMVRARFPFRRICPMEPDFQPGGQR